MHGSGTPEYPDRRKNLNRGGGQTSAEDPRRIRAGDIGEAVATALDAAGGKNLEISAPDVAGQCLQSGLVDEILVYVPPVLLGDGIRFSLPGRREDRPGTAQQHAVGRRHHPPFPRPQQSDHERTAVPDLFVKLHAHPTKRSPHLERTRGRPAHRAPCQNVGLPS